MVGGVSTCPGDLRRRVGGPRPIDSAARVLRMMFYSEETSGGKGQFCRDVFRDKGWGRPHAEGKLSGIRATLVSA